MSRENSILTAIRGLMRKESAYEVTPDGAGGHRYRDIGGVSQAGPGTAGQSRYMRAFGHRSDVQAAQESLAAKRSLQDGTWLDPSYSSNMREAGRSPESQRTMFNMTAQRSGVSPEVQALVRRYWQQKGLSPAMQRRIMRDPQLMKELSQTLDISRTPPAQARTAVQTPAQSRPSAAAAVPLAVQTPAQAQPVQTPAQSRPSAAAAVPPAVQTPAQAQPVQTPAQAQPAVQAQQPAMQQLSPEEQYHQGLIDYGQLLKIHSEQNKRDAAARAEAKRNQPRKYYHGAGVWKDTPIRPSTNVHPYTNSEGYTLAQMKQMVPGQPDSFYANAVGYQKAQPAAQTAQVPQANVAQQAASSGVDTNHDSLLGVDSEGMNIDLPVASMPKPLSGSTAQTKSPYTKNYESAGKNFADGQVKNRLTGEQLPLNEGGDAMKGNGIATTCPTCGGTGKKAEFSARPGLLAIIRDSMHGSVKTAQSIAFGGGPVPSVDTRNWTKDDWRRFLGMAVGAPFVAASLPAAATAGTVGGAASALGGAALSGLGGYGAGTSAFDAGDAVTRGDYGAAARSAATAVLSAGFPLAGKVPGAAAAAKGAAGALAGTDLVRAGVYAANGMPSAAAAAASGAAGDLSMFLPGGGLKSRLLTGLGLYGVSPAAHAYEGAAVDNALADKENALYGRMADRTRDAATDILKAHGIDVKPYANDIAAEAVNSAAQAYVADTPAAEAAYANRGRARKLVSGLLGTEGLDAVKAREGLANAEGVTPGGRDAHWRLVDDFNEAGPYIKAQQDYERSWRGKLDRALGWAGRHKGLAAAGAGAGLLAGALIWRAIAARRRRKREEEARRAALA